MMREAGSTGIASAILLIAILLMGSSAIYTTISQDSISSGDFENKVNEILDDITSYFLVKEGYAKIDGNEIKILLLVKPIFDDPISISNLTLQVIDDDSIHVLKLHDIYETGKDLFDSDLWSEINQSFCIIPVVDRDESISKEKTVNGDLFYVALCLRGIEIGEDIEISILSETGSISVLTIDIPFSTSDVFKIY